MAVSHTCCPSLSAYEQTAPNCSEKVKVDDRWVPCGKPLVRILHGPGHLIDGKPCGFPDQWRYCWISKELAATQTDDLLTLPRWKVV